MTQNGAGQSVVITGAAGDMGQAFAASFLADGFTVYGGDVRDVPKAKGLIAVGLDVTDRDAVFALAKRSAKDSRLAVWINAAGIVSIDSIEEADEATWERIIAINLGGTYHGCAAALEAMRGNQPPGGRIINIGSISGQLGGLGPHPGYGASKAGVHALTKTYALAGARHGITCNAVAPSIVEGSMAEEFSGAQLEKYIKAIPQHRLASMDEVVAAVRHLASPGASYTNGVVYQLNGAQLMIG
ncbi:MAG: SDR family NAD(P)-dependent oxidoreductase [Alphaproteobacteria bacterium]